MARAAELVESAEPEAVSIFSTVNQTLRTDQMFLDSAARVSPFFEEKAFDAEGKLTVPLSRACNKIGHGARTLSS